jgi:hypothetical protein
MAPDVNTDCRVLFQDVVVDVVVAAVVVVIVVVSSRSHLQWFTGQGPNPGTYE